MLFMQKILNIYALKCFFRVEAVDFFLIFWQNNISLLIFFANKITKKCKQDEIVILMFLMFLFLDGLDPLTNVTNLPQGVRYPSI